MVKGSVVLPAGTGKTVRVAVIAKDEEEQDEAKKLLVLISLVAMI